MQIHSRRIWSGYVIAMEMCQTTICKHTRKRQQTRFHTQIEDKSTINTKKPNDTNMDMAKFHNLTFAYIIE